MRKFIEEDDSDDDEDDGNQRKLARFTSITPDTLFQANSITFFYKDGKIYTEKYPTTHNNMLIKGGLHDIIMPHEPKWDGNRDSLQQYRDTAIQNAILGRIGEHEYHHTICIWNRKIDENEFKQCIKLLVQKFPYLSKNPNAVVLASLYDNAFYPKYLSDLLPEIQANPNAPDATEKEQDDEKCKSSASINVDGKKIDFNTVFGNLHMVRGTNYDKMRTAFCSQSDSLTNSLSQLNCPDSLNNLNQLKDRFDCPKNNQCAWNQYLKAGKCVYKDELKKTFGNPEKLDREFRTQKDLDAAWDYLQKKEHKLNFKEWLNNET